MLRYIVVLILFSSCQAREKEIEETAARTETFETAARSFDTLGAPEPREEKRDTSHKLDAPRNEVVKFAKTLTGIPYKYGSSDPQEGFDCSGFISYVYNHFNENVPRSSVEFTNLGREVAVSNAKAGDLILFTGTDSTIRTVGHMGIVVENADSLRFIHSTSGKAWGVTITALNNYYRGRFVKIIDLY